MQLRLHILSFIWLLLDKRKLIGLHLFSKLNMLKKMQSVEFSGLSDIWYALPESTKPLCLSLHMALLRLLCLALARCHCVSVSTSQMATHKHINTRHSRAGLPNPSPRAWRKYKSDAEKQRRYLNLPGTDLIRPVRTQLRQAPSSFCKI